jgi:transposase
MSAHRYTAEFKAEAVKQVTERGHTVKDVAKRLGVSPYSLYEWVGGVRKLRHDKSDESLRVENARLKSELKRTEEERDILKKAAAYFAKGSG